MAESFPIALSTMGIERPLCYEDVVRSLEAEAMLAAEKGARLLVFPEYGSMVLTGLPGMTTDPNDVRSQIEAIQVWREQWLQTHLELAKKHGLSIIASSFPWRGSNDTTTNRAWLCHPDGRYDFQDKQMMTRFEREQWDIASGGGGLKVFEVGGIRLAIAICYDVEFPLLVRAAAEAGAELIVTPSNTDGWHGYWRVCTGARARALENQCYVAMAPLVGVADWTTAIDVNVGMTGVFGPIDTGFPEDGILAKGEQAGGLLCAESFPARLRSVRRHGQNHNFADWDLQP
ncbi:MAG: carbon-nitrogen hydrolase family protein [Verrucomicrobiales bacterium]